MSDSATTDSINPMTPFDAHTYYAGLRALGANPCIYRLPDGAFAEIISHVDRTGDEGPLNMWAMKSDSDWKQRKLYAREVWESRPASETPVQFQYVPLGA